MRWESERLSGVTNDIDFLITIMHGQALRDGAGWSSGYRWIEGEQRRVEIIRW